MVKSDRGLQLGEMVSSEEINGQPDTGKPLKQHGLVITRKGKELKNENK